ncbi:MAG: hypothetical protein RL446_228, partial [Pseudomonadota bacterium]
VALGAAQQGTNGTGDDWQTLRAEDKAAETTTAKVDTKTIDVEAKDKTGGSH